MYPARESVNVANNNATQAARVTRTSKAAYIGETQQRSFGDHRAPVLNQQRHVVYTRGNGNQAWGENSDIQTTGRPMSIFDRDGAHRYGLARRA